MRNAAYWIKQLELKKHAEGGYYREIYRSDIIVAGSALPDRFSGARSISTAIYFLLCEHEFSALHRIKSDELWHFYCGDSLTIHTIDQKGIYTQSKLGRDFDNNEKFQVVVRSGCWLGAALNNPLSFSLVGCTVSPGFDFADFELGSRTELIKLYPEHRSIIERLTR